MSTQIIPLDEIRFEQWLPLWQEYLNFYKTQLSDEQISLSWKRITNSEQADMFGFAIQVNNEVVGFVHLISHMSMWTDKPCCYLQDLYVNETHRNQGLARKLIEHSYQVCSGKYDRVYWLTHESNFTAQYLYDRIATKTGFIQYKKAL
ncbi:GNAT family N-acetyltransferase [Acinetobacter wuhouensis]|uniref:GNAT family N-acetyltransferase n=1 Tax=Acinetobacter wuhouensis TaxID=1879050 RepID=A0A4Q7AGJ2_9GAMM|nr:GNAT family N-acetyltransferase [Acinetobacter wuhouensis]RZG46665.1 GNAT family N-acetyltransferase [Acinetobacter wuhouensis]RZG72422.1 GNAT family N-acetyltransferase [Acinetobacter wuhouensis]